MTKLSIVGGVYHELCVWPAWDQVYGSAGRAALALVGHVDEIALTTYENRNTKLFRELAELDGVQVNAPEPGPDVSFRYVHSLSPPTIKPMPPILPKRPSLKVEAAAVLQFGMLEGTAIVIA